MDVTPHAPTPRLVVENQNGKPQSTAEQPDDVPLSVAGEQDTTVRSGSPTRWWRYGLIGILVVAGAMVLLQLFNGAPMS